MGTKLPYPYPYPYGNVVYKSLAPYLEIRVEDGNLVFSIGEGEVKVPIVWGFSIIKAIATALSSYYNSQTLELKYLKQQLIKTNK